MLRCDVQAVTTKHFNEMFSKESAVFLDGPECAVTQRRVVAEQHGIQSGGRLIDFEWRW